ncbi:TPA_asm: UL40.7 dORF [Human alphaherpesvirus 1]|nr:TPA_asm: UL40.7 dORF [Human alphaherpesvirus 1]
MGVKYPAGAPRPRRLTRWCVWANFIIPNKPMSGQL